MYRVYVNHTIGISRFIETLVGYPAACSGESFFIPSSMFLGLGMQSTIPGGRPNRPLLSEETGVLSHTVWSRVPYGQMAGASPTSARDYRIMESVKTTLINA